MSTKTVLIDKIDEFSALVTTNISDSIKIRDSVIVTVISTKDSKYKNLIVKKENRSIYAYLTIEIDELDVLFIRKDSEMTKLLSLC